MTSSTDGETPVTEAQADASSSPLIKKIGGHFTIERELGRGGMATVYLCVDDRTGDKVAVKVLLAELASPVVIERFLREIKFASELEHPRIPKVFDSGVVDGMPYYAMTYIEGESLRSRLVREKQLPIPAAIKIICEVIGATSYAHERGIVHRDIKPENILLSKDGVYVLDFGIARAVVESGMDRLTSTGIGVGTPAYMSPEQALGDRALDLRSDIYSIGCVLYEMVGGIPPFVGPTAQVIISRRFAAPAPPMSELRDGVPDFLENAVSRALARAPADRWETASQMSDALNEGASGSWTVTRDRLQQTAPPKQTWMRSKPSIAGVALLLVALVGGTWQAFARNKTTSHRPAGPGLDARQIAVLYFRDLSPTHELGYLADGLTESVIDQLDQSGVDVVSKNGAQQVRETNLQPDSAARLLKAGTLVDGSIQPVGNRISAVVTLIDGNTGDEVNRATFEVPSDDPLRLRQQLVQNVADFLRKHVGEEVRLREWKAGTSNDEAWLLAERAERSMKDAEASTAAGDSTRAGQNLDRADSLLKLSESRDRRWIQPLLLRGTVAFRRSRISATPTEMLRWADEGLKSAETAVALDSTNAAALELRGTLSYWKYLNDLIPDSKESSRALRLAEADLKEAVRIDKHRATAWSVLSTLYANKDDPQEAALAARTAYDEDKYLSAAPDILWRLYNTAYDNEQRVQAEDYCGKGLERFPANPRFTQCRLWLFTLPGEKRGVAEAWRLVGELKKVTPASDWAFASREAAILVAAAIGRAGNLDSARRVLVRSRGNPSIDPSRDLIIDEAVVRTIIGDKMEAIALLKQYLVANPEHRAGMAETQSWWWRDLKTDPRYREMVGGVTNR